MNFEMEEPDHESRNLLHEAETSEDTDQQPQRERTRSSRRQLIAFWFFGLCNNYAYVIMLSAAHDILTPHDPGGNTTQNNSRDCNPISTSAVLIADVVPSFIVKLILPYFDIPMNIRVVVVCVLSAGSFLLVGLSNLRALDFIGVILAALSSGFGELSFLGYSSYFQRNVVSAWSSGTGASGVFGALSYALLTQIGVSHEHSVLIMLVVPVLLAIMFWGVLEKPQSHAVLQGNDDPHLSLKEKLVFFPRLLPYMAALFFVYISEYFINQGLIELIWFSGIWLNHQDQYRWYQVTYQIGVMISRSSVNLIHIKHVWIFSVLQLVNVGIFLSDAIWWYIPNFWIIVVLVLWEGLLGGAAYVNTFFRISTVIEPRYKNYAMSATSVADSAGVALAGVIGIPVHNALCSLPAPV